MRRVHVYALVVLALILGACAKPEPKLRVLWPPPPSEPKLEFSGSYYSQSDFPKSKGEKLAKAVLGDAYTGTFKTPFGIASDGKGKVYVSDIHHKNVRVWDFNNESITFLSKQRIFSTPLGLTIDSEDNLYVADGAQGVVMVFSPEGEYLRSFGKDVFTKPAYVALNENLGRIYVSDGKGHQIHVFDMGGEHLFSFGRRGSGEEGLYGPQGVAIDAQGRVYVADMFNARVHIFDAEGNHVNFFGERGDRIGQFEFPKALAFDGDGNLWISDTKRHSLQAFTTDGEVLVNLDAGGSSAHILGFSTPTGLFIDENQRIYVADGINRRFVIWQYLTDEYLADHPVTEEDRKRIMRRIEGKGDE